MGGIHFPFVSSVFGIVVAASVVFVLPKFFGRTDSRRKTGGRTGPRATEGLVTSGQIVNDYDTVLSKLWGGPRPKYYEDAMQTWKEKYDLTGKVAVVTGGAGGVGFYISKLLARLGCRVIIPWREGLEFEANSARDAIRKAVGPSALVDVSTKPLDLSSFASVRSFAQDIKGKLKSLDILCLNAGRGGAKGDPREVTSDGCESIMQVNALSHFLLTAELMPLLKAAKAARVISQSSAGRMHWGAKSDFSQRMRDDLSGEKIAPEAYNAVTQYLVSKAAQCFFTLGLNKRLQAAGVDNVVAVAAEPGFACTGVNIQHNLGHSALGFSDGLVPTCALHDFFGHHAADGALNAVMACADPDVEGNFFFSPRDGASGPPTKHTVQSLRKTKDAKKDPMVVPTADSDGSFWGDRDEMTERFWMQAAAASKAVWAL